MGIDLYDHQLEAVEKLKNGSILCGGVGTGKSRTALAYYFLKECRGSITVNGKGSLKNMEEPRDLYIITTAKKRDSLEWEKECAPFLLTSKPEDSISGVKVTIDSWNNIKKYTKLYGCFFIFDEQRVVGSGAWVKAFLKITTKNHWILLSATPGDTWSDYIPVFVANGFYRNKTDFAEKHGVYKRISNHWIMDKNKYLNTGRLNALRNKITVKMKYQKETNPNHMFVMVEYDKKLYSRVWRDRWDVYDNEPIQETGKLFYLMRRVVNSDPSRIDKVKALVTKHKRVIVFYNFDYELEMLRVLFSEMKIVFREWNGQKHEPVPIGESWVYLVQYLAGAEGWNCITTDTIVFYSQNYSYRTTTQAAGRIDRLNTPYSELYYYHLKSYAPIDIAISRALSEKRNFNERAFLDS